MCNSNERLSTGSQLPALGLQPDVHRLGYLPLEAGEIGSMPGLHSACISFWRGSRRMGALKL